MAEKQAAVRQGALVEAFRVPEGGRLGCAASKIGVCPGSGLGVRAGAGGALGRFCLLGPVGLGWRRAGGLSPRPRLPGRRREAISSFLGVQKGDQVFVGLLHRMEQVVALPLLSLIFQTGPVRVGFHGPLAVRALDA